MPTRNEYIDFLTEWLSPLGEITSRAMFGGHCLYCDGIVFALVAGQTFYLKVDETTRPRYDALGLKPFQPYADRPETMPYCPPPAEFFEDSDVMADWGGAAVAVARRGKLKKKTPAKKAVAKKRAARR